MSRFKIPEDPRREASKFFAYIGLGLILSSAVGLALGASGVINVVLIAGLIMLLISLLLL